MAAPTLGENKYTIVANNFNRLHGCKEYGSKKRRFTMPDKIEELDSEFAKLLEGLEEEEEEEVEEEEVDEEQLEDEDDPEVQVDDEEEDDLEEDDEEEEEDDLLNSTFEVDKQAEKDAAAFKAMREESARLKKELEERDRKLQELEQLSKQSGYKSTDELVEEWRKQQITEQAKKQGLPAEVLQEMEDQKRRLSAIEQEKQEIERKAKQREVVGQIDAVVADLKLTKEQADTVINKMGEDGVTWEQLLVLPPKAIENSVRGYASDILLEKERQTLLKGKERKQKLQEGKIKTKKSKGKSNDPFSDEALKKEMEEYKKQNYPHL